MDRQAVNRLVEDWMQGRDAPRALRVWVATTLSGLVFPGLGQMYNRQFRKGLLFAVAAAVFTSIFVFGVASGVAEAVSEGPLLLEPDRALAVAERVVGSDGGVTAGVAAAMMVTWAAATVDAYLVARRRRP